MLNLDNAWFISFVHLELCNVMLHYMLLDDVYRLFIADLAIPARVRQFIGDGV